MHDPPMGEPTVEDEPMEDPRVGDPLEDTHPVHDSPEKDPSGEDEPLEVLPMENNGQDHPVKRDAAFECVSAFPHHLKGSRHRRKLFLLLVYLHVSPRIAVTAVKADGRFRVFWYH